MQEVYDLNAIMNSEIRFRWLRLCVRSRWEEAVPMALKMATEQGRMKYTRPLFRYLYTPGIELYNYEKYRDEAVRVFLAHRAAMHPVTSGLVAKDLKLNASKTTGLTSRPPACNWSQDQQTSRPPACNWSQDQQTCRPPACNGSQDHQDHQDQQTTRPPACNGSQDQQTTSPGSSL
ncbi:Leukotriene A-4 hydrolase [Liparis tanakae]|uniref:Leukotriene A-4 hydrolase n=1 Tax=Liparis tanakae TaxID=230148 RepID=A0A4Z2EDI9_9TELE|nr:Leukotriene A-4 hydrolase [Liparis tanakae]